MLKSSNVDGLGLPLNKPKTIALFGVHGGPGLAGPNGPFTVGGTGSDVYQGHLVGGGGSGAISLHYVVTPYEAINARAIADGSMAWWILNDTVSNKCPAALPFSICHKGVSKLEK